MEIVDSRLVTGKTMFECLYEPFTKRRKKGGKDDGVLFSGVELSPHMFVAMGPINKEPDKFIAICIQNDEEDGPFILKSVRVDDFDRENAEMALHLLMLEFLEDVMVETQSLKGTLQKEVAEVLEYIGHDMPDDGQEE
ncbi:MAG: hypothetical protein IKG39_10860 [Lachnospiraceae bacterium]|nr:hypothetical protein [Lachnospiraceae bacterium]